MGRWPRRTGAPAHRNTGTQGAGCTITCRAATQAVFTITLAGLGGKADLERGGPLMAGHRKHRKGQRRHERPSNRLHHVWSPLDSRLRPCQACQAARPGPLLPAPSLGYDFALNHFGVPTLALPGTQVAPTLPPVPVPGTVPVPVLSKEQGMRDPSSREQQEQASRDMALSPTLPRTHTTRTGGGGGESKREQ